MELLRQRGGYYVIVCTVYLAVIAYVNTEYLPAETSPYLQVVTVSSGRPFQLLLLRENVGTTGIHVTLDP